MPGDEMELLRQLATNFRAATDEARPLLREREVMGRFPKDCCDHACTLLLIYFNNSGIEDFVFVTADLYKSRRSGRLDAPHVWLEKGDIVIDITADQFRKINERVIVSRDSAWHRSLKIESREPAGTPDESEAAYCRRILTCDYYRMAYETICGFLGPAT